jgi:hypothetical protein
VSFSLSTGKKIKRDLQNLAAQNMAFCLDSRFFQIFLVETTYNILGVKTFMVALSPCWDITTNSSMILTHKHQ